MVFEPWPLASCMHPINMHPPPSMSQEKARHQGGDKQMI